MKQIIKNIALFAVVGLLILATGGFTIYQHFCHCEEEVSASVFMKTSCDHRHSSPAAPCCKAEQTPSCCKEKPAPARKHHCNGKDCCKTSSRFLKINDSFQSGPGKITVKPVLVASAIVFDYIEKEIPFHINLSLCNSDLPPPDTGRQIVVSLHQLKLDPSLV
jgi:hypothetical protein